MSSENHPVRKAWIRHARTLALRKWLLVALGVALVGGAALSVMSHRRPAAPRIATVVPHHDTTKSSDKTVAPPAPPAPGTEPTAAAKSPPPAAAVKSNVVPTGTAGGPAEPQPAPELRSTSVGQSALILAAPPLAPTPVPQVALPPQAATTPAAEPPAKAAVPELPTVAVAPPGFHVVPSDESTKRLGTVTISDRKGRILHVVPPASPGQRGVVSSAPSSAVATATPLANAGSVVAVANPAIFSGHARAAGPLTLAVQGQTVRLFGVKTADPQDRCAAPSGKAQSCAALAEAALKQKLAGHSIVACRVPPGQRGELGAICLDEQGNDLGRFLVIEGLALADSAQGYDYLPAEGAARSARRGLWRFR
ncbi:MAG: hypothetical protein KGL11_03700 [Alphaproteobacteria bacterium]|nr:hypothetical protein [Alphaproteobacteria bacterium]